ncbi:MAG: hypothetical protein A2Y39_05145 [Candidatus Delongbacteria bacterium GWF2_40_14]|nr:MAG: hypothetical protein A2Y39_05145 [Candidatus Delongbacteria bacterium GWF2_40_14]
MKTNLSLNKETIAKLNMSEMKQMRGGDDPPATETNNYYSCWIWQTCRTVCIDTCQNTCVCTVGTGTCC